MFVPEEIDVCRVDKVEPPYSSGSTSGRRQRCLRSGSIARFEGRYTVDEQPCEVHDDHHRYLDVKGYEIDTGEVRYDGRPSLDYAKDISEARTRVKGDGRLTDDESRRRQYNEGRAPRPCPGCAIFKFTERSALTHPCFAEAPASQSNGDPGDLRCLLRKRVVIVAYRMNSYLVRNADDVLQPVPELPATNKAASEAQYAHAASGKKCWNGNTRFRSPREYPRCLWLG